MKRITGIFAAAIIMCGTFAGCSAGKEKVSTDGSTSMEKVIGVLGETFEKDTGITVTYNPTGSGIKAVAEGAVSLACFGGGFAIARKMDIARGK